MGPRPPVATLTGPATSSRGRSERCGLGSGFPPSPSRTFPRLASAAAGCDESPNGLAVGTP
jgi:hypothetical protein